jgi:hypothetical protein
MKKMLAGALVFSAVLTAHAEPLKVAVLDFENSASFSGSNDLFGAVDSKNLADKGIYALGAALANAEGFVLIDRRDFLGESDPAVKAAGGKEGESRRSFLKAAQAVDADAVLRGVLLSFSPGKEVVTQGGFKTEFVTLSMRVALQALDTRDGTIIASAEGGASDKIRQTDSVRRTLGEDELFAMLKSSIDNAVPGLGELLAKRFEAARARPKVKLSVKTSADPAMVEIDGMLIGTTPLDGFETYKGDHIITVGKAGYRDVNKRVMLESDIAIEIPMLRTELSADELKEVLETMRMNVILGVPEPPLIINAIQME